MINTITKINWRRKGFSLSCQSLMETMAETQDQEHGETRTEAEPMEGCCLAGLLLMASSAHLLMGSRSGT